PLTAVSSERASCTGSEMHTDTKVSVHPNLVNLLIIDRCSAFFPMLNLLLCASCLVWQSIVESDNGALLMTEWARRVGDLFLIRAITNTNVNRVGVRPTVSPC